MASTETHELVRDYYGKELASSADLQTSCCTAEAPTPKHAAILGGAQLETRGVDATRNHREVFFHA